MEISKKFIEIYLSAREEINDLIGVTPENYKLLLFIDPKLYDSVLLQTLKAGSPRALISSNELQVLKELKDKNYIPSGIDLFYPSINSKIFMPYSRITNFENEKIIKAKLIYAFAKAILIENTNSRIPFNLEDLYRKDAIISDLFQNNVYEFVKERGAPWIWQYFQDFTASLRLLSLYDLDDFYVPPNRIRSASIFYNYLLEIKDITKERAKSVLKAPLFDLTLNGFAEVVLEEYLKRYDKSQIDEILPWLKGNLGQPLGVIGKQFLLGQNDSFKDIIDYTFNLKDDYELTSIWNRSETKEKLNEAREKLTNRAIVWHSSKASYWSDLWPLRASQYDKIANSYVGKIQRRGYKTFENLLTDSPLVTSHGRVELKDREVAVFAIQEDTIGQQQLLILRNHLQAKKDSFSTPLPGLPDVIVFKKFAGMHIASYLGIKDKNMDLKYPSSPYDLPFVVRAIQVTKRKDAYQSEERDADVGKMDTANYDNLEKLTEPQHRAIKYLIRQGEIQ